MAESTHRTQVHQITVHLKNRKKIKHTIQVLGDNTFYDLKCVFKGIGLKQVCTRYFKGDKIDFGGIFYIGNADCFDTDEKLELIKGKKFKNERRVYVEDLLEDSNDKYDFMDFKNSMIQYTIAFDRFVPAERNVSYPVQINGKEKTPIELDDSDNYSYSDSGEDSDDDDSDHSEADEDSDDSGADADDDSDHSGGDEPDDSDHSGDDDASDSKHCDDDAAGHSKHSDDDDDDAGDDSDHSSDDTIAYSDHSGDDTTAYSDHSRGDAADDDLDHSGDGSDDDSNGTMLICRQRFKALALDECIFTM